MVSITAGGVNLLQQTLENEMKILVLESIIEKMVQTGNVNAVTNEDLAIFRKEAFERIRDKYPDVGVKLQAKR